MCRGETLSSLLWVPLGQMRSMAPMGGRLEHCALIPRVQGCLLLPQTGRGGPTILGNDERRIGIPTGPSFPLQQSTRSVPSPRYLSAQTQASSPAQPRLLPSFHSCLFKFTFLPCRFTPGRGTRLLPSPSRHLSNPFVRSSRLTLYFLIVSHS